jgi:hypothetical protein
MMTMTFTLFASEGSTHEAANSNEAAAESMLQHTLNRV